MVPAEPGLSPVSSGLRKPRDVASRSRYYYFSLGVSFFQIPDCLRDFTQAVAPVNHRLYLTGFHEFAQDVQVFFARLSQHHYEALAYESRQKKRLDHTNQRTEQATVRSPPTMTQLPFGFKTRLHADREWFPMESRIRS